MNRNHLSLTATDQQTTISLRHLTLAELRQLDHYLNEVGPFGELRMIVEKGRVKYMEVVRSHRVGGG